jgi:putative membrane protein
MIILLIIALLIAILAIVFALQNTAAVTITFLVWTFQGSLALVMILALVAGVLLAFFALLPSSIRLRLRASSHKRDKSDLERSLESCQQEVESLRQQLGESKEALPEGKENTGETSHSNG